MAARPSWADLPEDLIAAIARCVPCLADRVRAARACRTWLEGVQTDRCPLQLPWLLLPYQIDVDLPLNTTRRASFFCVLCNRVHRVAVPHNTRGARFFGTYPGGWLFLGAVQNYGHRLINLRTHESLYLPDNIIGVRDGWAWQDPMFIHAATLSAPPATLEGCVAAAIITVLVPEYFGTSHITLWRMGSLVASDSCTFQLNAEDVIHHNGAFHFLTQQGDLLLCTPEFQNGAPLEQLQVRGEMRMMMGCQLHDGPRYLVECRGELLMVLRVQPHLGVTSSFRVFRMEQEQVPDADHAHYGWTELPALDGRMLFVGRGCSRSFEAAQFPGSQEGVYFLDDGSFHGWLIRFGDGTFRYGCCSNGVWSGPPDHVHHWLPLQRPSTYSSPVWFLH